MKLTKLQIQILRLYAEGLCAKQISGVTGKSDKNIWCRVYDARKTNSCASTYQLIHLATKEGLI
jgi:DNA-binding NarL/FixJ family response regulator